MSHQPHERPRATAYLRHPPICATEPVRLVFPPVATATTDGARPWVARSYVAAARLLGARPWPLIFSARGPLISRPPVSVICLRAMLRRHAPLRLRRSEPAVTSLRLAR